MINSILTNNKFVRFIIIFIIVFLVCYYGTLFITGLAVPNGSFSPFIFKYLNIAAWLRTSLILACKYLLTLFSIDTFRVDDYVLKSANGRGVRIVYSCLGFGVMSFWIAYIVANIVSVKKKIGWIFAGCFFLWLLNVVRISLVLTAGIKGWFFPFGWDHHTWFNIVAYVAIFAMIYLFEKGLKKNL